MYNRLPEDEPSGSKHVEDKKKIKIKISLSSYICHRVGPLVDPFRSHVSRSLFRGLP